MSSEQASRSLSPVLAVTTQDITASRRAYERFLGIEADSPLCVGNATVELRSGAAQDTPHRAFFGAADLAATTRLLRRRGLALSEAAAGRAEAEHEPSVGVIEDAPEASAPDSDLTAVDHLVFNAGDRDAAVALFGATLGLDYRLEQSIHDGIHQLFFRAPTLVVEVVVGQSDPGSRTELWGIAWRSVDIALTHRRLQDAGVDVSEMRAGRAPGTRVFSVRDRALGLPTLVID